MSRAVELAKECGSTIVGGDDGVDTQCWTGDIAFLPEDLEAFYHAARAEALREAAELVGTSVTNGWPCAEELAAKADREGK